MMYQNIVDTFLEKRRKEQSLSWWQKAEGYSSCIRKLSIGYLPSLASARAVWHCRRWNGYSEEEDRYGLAIAVEVEAFVEERPMSRLGARGMWSEVTVVTCSLGLWKTESAVMGAICKEMGGNKAIRPSLTSIEWPWWLLGAAASTVGSGSARRTIAVRPILYLAWSSELSRTSCGRRQAALQGQPSIRELTPDTTLGRYCRRRLRSIDYHIQPRK